MKEEKCLAVPSRKTVPFPFLGAMFQGVLAVQHSLLEPYQSITRHERVFSQPFTAISTCCKLQIELHGIKIVVSPTLSVHLSIHGFREKLRAVTLFRLQESIHSRCPFFNLGVNTMIVPYFIWARSKISISTISLISVFLKHPQFLICTERREICHLEIRSVEFQW